MSEAGSRVPPPDVSTAPSPAVAVRSSDIAARALRVGVMLGIAFLLASVAWDWLVAPEHMARLLAWRAGGAAFLVAAGTLSYAMPHRAMWLSAAATGGAAVSVTSAALILPYGFAYAIGALVLIAMAIGFVSLEGRSAVVASATVVVTTTAVLIAGRATEEIFYAIGFFVLPALVAATAFAFVGADQRERARQVRRELLALREDLARFGHSDELTGVYDDKQLHVMARREIALARRRKSTMSALKIDVAQLAAINEKHGRGAGDETLRAVASMCQAALRETDLLARVAGDEFAALLPEADVDGAALICDRLRKSLQKASVLAGTQVLEVTVAVGAATLVESDKTIEDLLKRADVAMRAERDGASSPAKEAAPA